MSIKDFIPPVLLKLKRARISKYGWFGNYLSWDDARKESSGYESKIILEKVAKATMRVKNGEAASERDSVVFQRAEHSWPLLASLLLVASQNDNSLSILDFGGSLGSSYFQYRKYFSSLRKFNWNIVEQKHFVQRGKKLFQDDQLKFYDDINSCVVNQRPDVVLFSSVLSYLENPYEVVNKIIGLKIPYIIIDRTLFIPGNEDRLTVQKVPPTIYDASYPCWIFGKEKFIQSLSNHYVLKEEFNAYEGTVVELENTTATFKGCFFQLKILDEGTKL